MRLSRRRWPARRARRRRFVLREVPGWEGWRLRDETRGGTRSRSGSKKVFKATLLLFNVIVRAAKACATESWFCGVEWLPDGHDELTRL